MKNKLNKIDNLNEDVKNELSKKTVQINVDSNIYNDADVIRIFESEWLDQITDGSIVSSETKNALVPSSAAFEYTTNVKISDDLIPFAKVSLKIKPPKDSYIIGSFLYNILTYQDWLKVECDGDIIYSGPNIVDRYPSFAYHLPIFENSGTTYFTKNGIDYPVEYKYGADVYKVYFKYNNGKYPDTIFYGTLGGMQFSDEPTYEPSYVGQVVNFTVASSIVGTGPQNARYAQQYPSGVWAVLDCLPITEMHITNVNANSITADAIVSSYADVGSGNIAHVFWSTYINSRTYQSFTFPLSFPEDAPGSFTSGRWIQLHDCYSPDELYNYNGLVYLQQDSNIEVVKVERVGKYVYINEQRSFLIQPSTVMNYDTYAPGFNDINPAGGLTNGVNMPSTIKYTYNPYPFPLLTNLIDKPSADLPGVDEYGTCSDITYKWTKIDKDNYTLTISSADIFLMSPALTEWGNQLAKTTTVKYKTLPAYKYYTSVSPLVGPFWTSVGDAGNPIQYTASSTTNNGYEYLPAYWADALTFKVKVNIDLVNSTHYHDDKEYYNVAEKNI
jgi:hypothetical protein